MNMQQIHSMKDASFVNHYQPTHKELKYLIFWMNSSDQIKYREKLCKYMQ